MEVVNHFGFSHQLLIFFRYFLEDDLIVILFGFIEFLLHFLIFDLEFDELILQLDDLEKKSVFIWLGIVVLAAFSGQIMRVNFFRVILAFLPLFFFLADRAFGL